MIRRAKDIDEHTPWQERTPAGVVFEAATARYVKTGAWRTDTPVLDAEKCRSCLLCVPFCPDSSLPVKDGKLVGIDYHHCKGCGICATVCPFGAITVKEGGQP